MSLPFSQSCENNKDPILTCLRQAFIDASRVLEIGSGTGQHAVYFAEHLPHLHWQPSDQGEYLAGLALRLATSSLPNLAAEIELDVGGRWPSQGFDAVFTANTCHIMAWSLVEKLFAGVARSLESGGTFCVYGPFNEGGCFTSDSNARFDQWLKQRDPDSGIRDLEAVVALAARHGLQLSVNYAMPANNRLLQFTKAEA
ncbi:MULTISPECIES: DUF938 domain-containing protein [Ferrimonas]|uniref:DUF938 domain-containing protein n=1 Tax=Ferrimonas TaxID=44011 RepID=UPI0004006469|nr:MULTISPECIES: DUF938 domain-containing protein [Ferrimonas]USD36334.1 DUF938 domain-containing protein [Ferrimonas sp. SCSIO 43195]